MLRRRFDANWILDLHSNDKGYAKYNAREPDNIAWFGWGSRGISYSDRTFAKYLEDWAKNQYPEWKRPLKWYHPMPDRPLGYIGLELLCDKPIELSVIFVEQLAHHLQFLDIEIAGKTKSMKL